MTVTDVAGLAVSKSEFPFEKTIRDLIALMGLTVNFQIRRRKIIM